jgi:hypothetical protein
MAFDLSTAAPVASGGFDLSTAQPVSGGGIPGPRRQWSDVPGEALANVPQSGAKFLGGLYEAITNPIQTVKGLLDIGAGTLQNITPNVLKDFVNRFETNPEAAQRAVATANAVGGEYAKRYGSVEGFKEALATDPIGVASDFSTLLSGGAAATAKIAPTAAKGLATAATYTNPAAPVVKAAEYGLGLGAKGVGNAIDFMQGQRAATRAGNIVRNALTEEGRTPQNMLAAQQAFQNAPPGSTVRQALADVVAPQVQYLGEMVEARAPGRAMTTRQAQEAGREARLAAVTPDLAAAEAIRSGTAAQLYGIADEALLPGRERQFKAVKVGETQGGVPLKEVETGTPRMVEVGRDPITNKPIMEQIMSVGGQPVYKHVLAGYKYDPELATLMERPAIQAAFNEASKIAANKGVAIFTNEGQLTGKGAHLVKLAIDDAINPTPGTPIARNTANALKSAKADYLNWVENKVPVYQLARETFKLQSEPVNQAQVLNAMQEVLKAPLGVGERVGPFMTAMGRGEQALLKKATGEPRYVELNQVLTPSQMKVVGEVKSELMRDARVADQAKVGAEAMKTILEANQSKFRLPDFMSVKVTLANQMLKLMEGKLNSKVMAELEKGFESGTSFVDLMKKVPASQRIEVLRALGQAQNQLSPTKINMLVQSRNALAPESQNALAP